MSYAGLTAIAGEGGTDMRANREAEQAPTEPAILGEPPPADEPAQEPSPEAVADRELFPTEQARHSAFAEARRTLSASFEQRYSARVSELEADYQSRLSEREQAHRAELEAVRAEVRQRKPDRPVEDQVIDLVRAHDRAAVAEAQLAGRAVPKSLAYAVADRAKRLLDPNVDVLSLDPADRALLVKARGPRWFLERISEQRPRMARKGIWR